MSTHILAPIAVPSLLPACPDVEPEGTSEKKANNRPTDRATEAARETKSRVHRTQKREREGRRRARAESESAHKEGTEPFAQELMDGKGWAGWAEHQWMTWTGAGDRSLGSGGDGQRERERERQKEKGHSISALQPQCHPLPCSRYSAWRVNHGAERRASARVRDRAAERISAQHGKENREQKAVRGGAESTREAAQPCPLFAAPLKHTGNAPSLTWPSLSVGHHPARTPLAVFLRRQQSEKEKSDCRGRGWGKGVTSRRKAVMSTLVLEHAQHGRAIGKRRLGSVRRKRMHAQADRQR